MEIKFTHNVARTNTMVALLLFIAMTALVFTLLSGIPSAPEPTIYSHSVTQTQTSSQTWDLPTMGRNPPSDVAPMTTPAKTTEPITGIRNEKTAKESK